MPTDTAVPNRATPIRLESSTIDSNELLVIITSERKSPDGEIPSIKLRNIATGDEFWSAFDDRGSPLPVNGRVSVTPGVTNVKLHLSSLKWARSRAALWPSRDLHDVIPPGEYEAVARLSPSRGAVQESNRVRLIIGMPE